MVRPSDSACGTVASMNFCRSSSLVKRLIFHFTDWSVLRDSLSGGPNIISTGCQNLFSDSCAIALCSGEPCASVITISKPWRWWKLSSLQIRIIARA